MRMLAKPEPWKPDHMQTGRGFERLVNFSDAVVAIALTLLVLPLVDLPAEVGAHESLRTLVDEHHTELTSFLISFLVIFAVWSAHHGVMEHFRGYDAVIVRLHELWLFTIVVLPFTTELLNGTAHINGAVPLYIANLLVSSMALLGISWRGRRHLELLKVDEPEVRDWLAKPLSLVLVAIMAVGLVVSIVFPSVGTWPLLLLVVDDPIDRLVHTLLRRPSRRAAG
jgi:uncharacterized membrane protein